MINLVQTMQFMMKAHKGQVDKGGKSYHMHPLRVMGRLGPTAAVCEKHAALLHDVVEDTKYTLADLRAIGYDTTTVGLVSLLTRLPGMSHADYIAQIIASGNRSAIRMKIADCYDNSAPGRVAALPESERGMEKRYQRDILLPTSSLPKYRWETIVKGDR